MKFRSKTHIKSENVRRMLQFVHDLRQIRSIEDFGRSLIQLTQGILPHAHVVVEENNVRSGQFRFFHNYDISTSVERELTETIYALYGQKPINQHLKKGKREKAIRNTDIVSYRDLIKTDFYQHVMKPLEGARQLYVMPAIPDVDLRLAVCRHKGELSDEVVEMFRLLADHIGMTYGHVMSQDHFKKIAKPRLTIDTPAGLTPRELEILYWVHQGKRNGEVAIILQISERTVEKHMQSIFRKLEVETRTSAAVRAAQLLNFDKSASSVHIVSGSSASFVSVHKPTLD